MKNGIYIINSDGKNEEIYYHLLYFTVIMDKESFKNIKYSYLYRNFKKRTHPYITSMYF